MSPDLSITYSGKTLKIHIHIHQRKSTNNDVGLLPIVITRSKCTETIK